jgi:hypothetical protein
MNHIAIMKKSWGLIPKIVSGEKTIESRWYQTRRAPWGKIAPGDTVYFKNSAEPVTAQATVAKVLQFSINSIADAEHVVQTYGKLIALVNPSPRAWGKLPRYCILIFLKHPKPVRTPWRVNKSGFGSATAWMTMHDIKKVRA